MPFSADQIIGKKLYAKMPVKALNSALQETGQIFPAGRLIGTVWSYVIRNGVVYWIIDKQSGFLIKQDATKLSLDPQERKDLEIRQQQQQIKNKGAVPYYIEKYGKWLLIAGLASVAIRELIKRKK